MTLGHLIREEMGGAEKVGQSSSSPKAVCNFRASEKWNVSGVPQVGAADHKVLLAVQCGVYKSSSRSLGSNVSVYCQIMMLDPTVNTSSVVHLDLNKL